MWLWPPEACSSSTECITTLLYAAASHTPAQPKQKGTQVSNLAALACAQPAVACNTTGGARTYSTATTLHQGMLCGKQVMSPMAHAAPGCQEASVLTLVHAACVLLIILHLLLGAHQHGASGRAWDGGPVVAQPPVAVLPVTPAYVSTGKTQNHNLRHKARLLLGAVRVLHGALCMQGCWLVLLYSPAEGGYAAKE